MAGGRGNLIRLSGWIGGEADMIPIAGMKPQYAVTLENCMPSDNGGIQNLPGFVKINTTDVTHYLENGYVFVKRDGTKIELVSGGGKIYQKAGGVLTEVYSGLDSGSVVRFVSHNNICIAMNGVNAPISTTNGSTWITAAGSPPATAFKGCVYRGRVWLIERSNKMKATFSALNKADDFTTLGDAGDIDFSTILKVGDELLDMMVYQGFLCFLFRNHILVYSGINPAGAEADFVMQQRIDGMGIMDTDACLSVGTDAVVVTQGGVKSIAQVISTGNINVDSLSPVYNKTIVEAISTATRFRIVHSPAHRFMLFLIGDTIFVYKYQLKAWAHYAGTPTISGMYSTPTGAAYWLGYNAVYEYGSGAMFDTERPKVVWSLPYITFSDVGEKFAPKMLEIIALPKAEASISLRLAYDMAEPSDTTSIDFTIKPGNLIYIDDVTDWDALTSIDETFYTSKRLPLMGRGSIMKMSLSTESGAEWEIVAINILYVKGGF